MLRSGRLFRPEPEEPKSHTRYDNLAVFVPSDPARLNNLSAGGENEESSQGYRLGLIKQSLQDQVADFPAILNQTELNSQPGFAESITLYQPLVDAIEHGQPQKAVNCFRALTKEPLMQLLLSVHSQSHIEQLIRACAKANTYEPTLLYRGNYDCLIKRDTFKLLLEDLIRVTTNPAPIKLSFGLPTHHAYHDRANGFCLLNTTAAMIHHMYHNDTLTKPIPFIIGLDINRDDGLNEILCRDEIMPFVHIDVCDPRVYPYHQISDIKDTMLSKGFTWHQMGAAHVFTRGQQSYHLIDLSEFTEREAHQLHPALNYIQTQLNHLLDADQKVAIVTPTGYDACDLETASCANYFALTDECMSDDAKQYQRLTMTDYAKMFDWLLMMTTQTESIVGLYYSLEGGYTAKAYSNLVVDLVNKAKDYAVLATPDMDLSTEMKCP